MSVCKEEREKLCVCDHGRVCESDRETKREIASQIDQEKERQAKYQSQDVLKINHMTSITTLLEVNN